MCLDHGIYFPYTSSILETIQFIVKIKVVLEQFTSSLLADLQNLSV